mgnify:CR=1 FL=1
MRDDSFLWAAELVGVTITVPQIAVTKSTLNMSILHKKGSCNTSFLGSGIAFSVATFRVNQAQSFTFFFVNRMEHLAVFGNKDHGGSGGRAGSKEKGKASDE